MENKPVDLETAKKLKQLGFSRKTEYYYQDVDLPYCSSGLKRTKNGVGMNHNIFDDFIYSAPFIDDANDFLKS